MLPSIAVKSTATLERKRPRSSRASARRSTSSGIACSAPLEMGPTEAVGPPSLPARLAQRRGGRSHFQHQPEQVSRNALGIVTRDEPFRGMQLLDEIFALQGAHS